MPEQERLNQTQYHIMISASEDALVALEDLNIGEAKRILIDAEQRAEEAYISAKE